MGLRNAEAEDFPELARLVLHNERIDDTVFTPLDRALTREAEETILVNDEGSHITGVCRIAKLTGNKEYRIVWLLPLVGVEMIPKARLLGSTLVEAVNKATATERRWKVWANFTGFSDRGEEQVQQWLRVFPKAEYEPPEHGQPHPTIAWVLEDAAKRLVDLGLAGGRTIRVIRERR